MRLSDLEYLNTYRIAAGQSFYRVQRARSMRGGLRRGPVKLAPPGVLSGRFDLAERPTAYFAEA